MYLFMTKVFLRHSLRPWNMLKIDPNYTFVVVACSTGETTDSMAHLQQKVVTNMHQKT